MAGETVALSEPLKRLLTSFSEPVAVAWLRQVFPTFAPNAFSIELPDALYRTAGLSNGRRLGSVFLRDEAGRRVELPVFLVRTERLGQGPQRKVQFLCAQRIWGQHGRGTGGASVQGALFFFRSEAERRTRFSLVTCRDTVGKETFRRQSFLLTSEPGRNQTFVRSFAGAKITALGTSGGAVARKERDTLLGKFSVEALTKEFYEALYAWYEWAAKPATGVRFPDAEGKESTLKEHLIRLITRLMFVWFVKEKITALGRFFDVTWLAKRLRAFDPESKAQGVYYNAILQNLFFATLNQPIESRAFASGTRFQGKAADYGIGSLFRDATAQEGSFFAVSQADVLAAFAPVPYLNGGLFECLDTDGDTGERVYRDGFSRNPKRRAKLPNALFFDKRKGLIPLLSRYDFTIDENHATDADIALDPELLGKVFENLLASYVPETDATARKASGSFYTPREIVDYMVDESLRATLEQVAPKADVATLLKGEGETLPAETRAILAKRLRNLKTLDPACGSGAFPMGLLNRIVELLGALEPSGESVYRRKLHLIEHGIYGVDIQPIAIQIAKLRFFISLLCDQEVHPTLPNAGLEQLPNLETHLVIANTLVGIDGAEDYLPTEEITDLRARLQALRNRHLHVHDRRAKLALRREDRSLRRQLQAALAAQHLRGTDLFAEWNPYDPCSSAPFFDAEWMFGFPSFSIVIGNPPYGAKLKAEEKARFKQAYRTAKTIPGKQKGSLDTYTLFIERGFRLLEKNGGLVFIVPISVTSSDSLTGVHRLLFENCEEIRLSSYAVRPQPIFLNATVNTSILQFIKTFTPCQRIYSTKMYRKREGMALEDILGTLAFTEVKPFLKPGRIPKIGSEIERNILEKLSRFPTLETKEVMFRGKPLYYRAAGGRYFKIITPYSTGSSAEHVLLFQPLDVKLYGALLSTSLSFWFYQIYSDNLNWKQCEIKAFPVPSMSIAQQSDLERLYEDYLADVEKNASVQTNSGDSSYNVDTFRAYHIGLSKAFIDRMDDFVGPLYGLTPEEVDFIKNYELSFRLHEEDATKPAPTSADDGDEEL